MAAIRPSLARLAGAALLLSATAGPLAAQAPAYPPDRITLIVAFAPGGFVDSFARIIGQKLNEKWGKAVTVENKAGAGGNTGAAQVAGAKPDGLTLLVTSTAIAINETLYKKRDYSLDQLVPVSISVSSPETIATHPSKPGTLKEYLAWAKGNDINFATAGVGSGSHLAAEYFLKVIAKTPATHIPFRGGALSVQAALGNQVDMVASSFGIIPQVQEGKLKGLAVASQSRVAAMPDVPTYTEAGFPFVAESWVAVLAPAKTPPAIVEALNAAIGEMLADPANRSKLLGMGYQIQNRSVPETSAYLKDEVSKWGEMVRTVGATVE
ncbi:MAG TPA: tripartite tricarboxylate transporter substrate-binding protein [Bosea sp. (in: a-proteobacteria)]|jgi:tripartite-type tricarboxylate transporter receptor subunit TctC|uniref:tripartite tricarboxylate transporter substrate-binding protein n=1 Tax=Bosea sp. (in: a-proteobacteria) TaxID=1871050 RepID=UPI002E0D7580|nr:tripartite tricarboxylate transporter substrate-binding protein [Bosea sp. (in: a-proteobacteria)]